MESFYINVNAFLCLYDLHSWYDNEFWVKEGKWIIVVKTWYAIYIRAAKGDFFFKIRTKLLSCFIWNESY